MTNFVYIHCVMTPYDNKVKMSTTYFEELHRSGSGTSNVHATLYVCSPGWFNWAGVLYCVTLPRCWHERTLPRSIVASRTQCAHRTV